LLCQSSELGLTEIHDWMLLYIALASGKIFEVPNGKDLLFVRPDAVFDKKKPISLPIAMRLAVNCKAVVLVFSPDCDLQGSLKGKSRRGSNSALPMMAATNSASVHAFSNSC
ncbi:hypothetical protein Taro_013438, partial [Colocasia esculenta]|nr:hypothetical protein [Colocasia esculenta]